MTVAITLLFTVNLFLRFKTLQNFLTQRRKDAAEIIDFALRAYLLGSVALYRFFSQIDRNSQRIRDFFQCKPLTRKAFRHETVTLPVEPL